MEEEKTEKILKTSFGFLWAREGYWINWDDKLFDMSDSEEMSNEYLENCINILERHKTDIEQYSKSYRKEDIMQMRDDKLDELKIELENRKFN